MFSCCCYRRRKDIDEKGATSPRSEVLILNKKFAPEDYIRCESCDSVPFSPDGLEKHREGKRHRKVISGGDVTERFSWVRRPASVEENLVNYDDNDVAQGRPLPTESTALNNHGKDEKGWQRVGGVVKMPSQPLVCLIKERNILSGCVNVPDFLSHGAESKVLQYIDTATEAAIKGRLRGTTYQSKHKPSSQGVDSVSLQLNFGCAQDWIHQRCIISGKVEPVPPPLRDFSRRILARSDVLDVSSAEEPDCVCIFDLRKDDFLPSSIASTSESGFVGPVYILSLCSSDDDILLGGIRPLETLGEFASLYAHRFSRRGLLKLEAGPLSFAVPRVKERLVLLVFRKLSKEIRDDQLARGNILQ
jgi:hypothetical protein